MNPEDVLHPDFWQAVSYSYVAGNYRTAILDALQYLDHALQDRAGVESGGPDLIEEALAGDPPRLRLLPLITDADHDVQEGFVELLRGMHRALRRPRRNAQLRDSQLSADAILLFINHLLAIIRQADAPFLVEKFLQRVFDPDFVENDRYAQLLVADIPDAYLLETLINIFRYKRNAGGRNPGYLVRRIIERMPDAEISIFLELVGEELKISQDDEDVTVTLQMLPPHLWPQINETARMRIESKLIQSIIRGEVYLFGTEVNEPGAIGTWANLYAKYFMLKDALAWVIIRKMEDTDSDDQRYVARYFFGVLPEIMESDYQVERMIAAIAQAVQDNHTMVQSALLGRFPEYPEKWQQLFRKQLKKFTNPDGSPFLPEAPDSGEK